MPEEDIKKIFLEAHEKYSDAIFRYIYYRVYDRELAKDLMQETFQNTWLHFAKGKKIEHLQAFLYMVAKNIIINNSRKNKTQSLDELMEMGFNPSNGNTEQKYNSQIDAENLCKSVNCLPEKYSEIIKMRFMEELSIDEIASILNESANNISVRINRALEKLRKNLNYLK